MGTTLGTGIHTLKAQLLLYYLSGQAQLSLSVWMLIIGAGSGLVTIWISAGGTRAAQSDTQLSQRSLVWGYSQHGGTWISSHAAAAAGMIISPTTAPGLSNLHWTHLDLDKGMAKHDVAIVSAGLYDGLSGSVYRHLLFLGSSVES